MLIVGRTSAQAQHLIAKSSLLMVLYTRRLRSMTTLTITIPDDRLSKLKELAARFHVSPEDLVNVSIEEILTCPEETFQQALHYVLKKNADLYRRLA
jgi:hypothetical protein